MSGASFHAIGVVKFDMQLGEITGVTRHRVGDESYVRIGWRAYGERGEPAQLDFDLTAAAFMRNELRRVLGE